MKRKKKSNTLNQQKEKKKKKKEKKWEMKNWGKIFAGRKKNLQGEFVL